VENAPPSNTAMRGFGGPQAMAVMETVIDRIARTLGRDPAEIRRLNFYRESARRRDPLRQTVSGNHLPLLFDRLIAVIGVSHAERRGGPVQRIARVHEERIALTPVKFGISFTTSFLNQAGALVLLYDDGTVLVNHGGTRDGTGTSHEDPPAGGDELGLDLRQVRISPTDTSKVRIHHPPRIIGYRSERGGVRDAITTLKHRIGAALALHFSEGNGGRRRAPATYCSREDAFSMRAIRIVRCRSATRCGGFAFTR